METRWIFWFPLGGGKNGVGIKTVCEVRLVGSLGLVAKGRLQFTSEPPLARALQLD